MDDDALHRPVEDLGDVRPHADPYTGRLLLATPMLTEDTFRRSVVVVLDHDQDGTLGVVINKPLPLEVGEVLAEWSTRTSGPPVMFGGGPVATDTALAVGVLAPGLTSAPLGWRQMFGRIGLVDLDTPPETLDGALSGLRVFAGYAGWGPGQLEGEVAEGAWLVLPSLDVDVVSPVPDRLWSDVLRRQPGEERLLSTYPEDPQLN